MKITEELYLSAEEVKRYKIKMLISRIVMYALLSIVALYILFPFYYMVISSFKTRSELQAEKFTFLPKSLYFANYSQAFLVRGTGNNSYSILTMYGNTLLVSIFTTLGTIVTTVLMAFAFARLNFKGKDLLFTLLLSTMMIPGEIYVVTNYQTLSGLRNSYIVLILPFLTSIFYTFFLRQSFKQIPNELYLASKVDGLTDFKYLFKVMIPIAKSSIITIIILSMIGTWNAYVWPKLMTSEGKYYLISNGLVSYFSSLTADNGPDVAIGPQMAVATLVTVPLIIAFIILRKYIMSGVGRSGIKG